MATLSKTLKTTQFWPTTVTKPLNQNCGNIIFISFIRCLVLEFLSIENCYSDHVQIVAPEGKRAKLSDTSISSSLSLTKYILWLREAPTHCTGHPFLFQHFKKFPPFFLERIHMQSWVALSKYNTGLLKNIIFSKLGAYEFETFVSLKVRTTKIVASSKFFRGYYFRSGHLLPSVRPESNI